MSSSIRVTSPDHYPDDVFAQVSAEDREILLNILRECLTHDFLKSYHLLLSMGCEISIPPHRPIPPKASRGGDQDEKAN